jgi:probable phosphoglycerate mutase
MVRHGATEWSQSGRHTGTTDVPLLPDGETEAVQLGHRLTGIEPVLVLSSPLRRALDTCRLAGFGDRVTTSEALVEMDYGDYEGITTAEIRVARPSWDLFVDGCPGGETIEQVAARIGGLLDTLRNDAGLVGRDVLVFAHGHAIRAGVAHWLWLGAQQARHFQIGSGKMGWLAWEHEWTTVSAWNL